MSLRLAATRALWIAAAALVAAAGCDPLSPQAFFAAPWNDEDACLESNAAVDVYDDEDAPVCSERGTCVEGPEGDGRLYVTTCPIPDGWKKVDADPRCADALTAYRSGKDGRCP